MILNSILGKMGFFSENNTSQGVEFMIKIAVDLEIEPNF